MAGFSSMAPLATRGNGYATADSESRNFHYAKQYSL